MARKFLLLLILPISVFLFVQLRHSPRGRLPVTLQGALTEQALSFLKNEFNILVGGTAPIDGLVPRLIGMARLEVSGEERIDALLKSREISLRRGKHYASIEVTLNLAGIEERDGGVVLHAVGNVVEHFTFDVLPSPPVPDLYQESTQHNFVFSVAPLSADPMSKPYSVRIGSFEYTLVKDITEPQLLNASDGEEDESQKYSRPPATPLKEPPPVNNRQRKKP